MLKNISKSKIGIGVEMHPSAQIHDLEELVIGDHTYIGPSVRINGGGVFKIGDYSKIHNNVYINARGYIEFGHCTWIGQGSHIDGTGKLVAGNYMAAGINSALYTHIRHGDVLEGCNYERDGILTIGHDVWLAGSCLVNPVRIGDKSMALLGSVIVHNMKKNTLYMGNPAEDITKKLRLVPWSEVNIAEKRNNMQFLIDEYCLQNNLEKEILQVVHDYLPLDQEDKNVTYYNINNRTYTKRNSNIEVAFNKDIFRYKAKFIPR
jgi:acetyltransferase-like isoleucine patch superfamily enzyme